MTGIPCPIEAILRKRRKLSSQVEKYSEKLTMDNAGHLWHYKSTAAFSADRAIEKQEASWPESSTTDLAFRMETFKLMD